MICHCNNVPRTRLMRPVKFTFIAIMQLPGVFGLLTGGLVSCKLYHVFDVTPYSVSIRRTPSWNVQRYSETEQLVMRHAWVVGFWAATCERLTECSIIESTFRSVICVKIIRYAYRSIESFPNTHQLALTTKLWAQYAQHCFEQKRAC